MRGSLSTGAFLLTQVAFGAVKVVLHQHERSFEIRTERTPLCRHTSRSQICVFSGSSLKILENGE